MSKFIRSTYFEKLNQRLLTMNERETQWEKTLLQNRYQQLHLTVIFEYDFLQELGSYQAVLDYRDVILDRINEKRRILGYIK